MIRIMLTALASGILAAFYVVMVAVIVASASGCSINKWEMIVAEDSCNGHHGLDYITLGFGVAMCNDGMSYGLVRP